MESTNLLGETPNVSNDLKDILPKLNLSRMEEWELQLRQAAQDLICEFTCIFCQDDLDLGKTSIVKHSIKVNDPVPLKEWYRCIPPGMYDEVKMHIQEMLDMGPIRPSNSPWASAVVLVWKKDGKLSIWKVLSETELKFSSKLTSFCSQTWLLLLVCLGNVFP